MFNSFSKYYDQFAYDIPYNKFYKYYKKIFSKNSLKPKLILDICCGTGTLTSLMASDFDMIGIDFSLEMLDIAKEKGNSDKILYLNQEMTDFELYGTVDACYSSLDSINYILNEKDLEKHFLLVKNYLNLGGLYIFDISTKYKFINILGENSFVDEIDDTMFVWQNYFKNDLNTMYLDIFYKENGHYNRISETHIEKAYSVLEIKRMVIKFGFKIEGIYDNLSFNPPNRKSERIFFVIRR
jgi:SAM-dependent methyltransferase